MEKITIWTNYFSSVRLEVEKELKAGKAVRVAADCIGHTRAQMIADDARKYFESVGAMIYEKNWCGDYWCLKKEEKPAPKKRGRKPKKVRL